eukprot:10300812-Alexandrium_andersonii.AAC.1
MARLCSFKAPRSAKAAPQPSKSQAYGRSPVWVRMCATKTLRFAKAAPQPSKSQAYGRSPVR